MKKFENLFYSKCPKCKKHGIKAFNKMAGNHNPMLTCKYCGKKYSMNMALAIIVKVGIASVIGLIALFFNKYIKLPFGYIVLLQ